MKVSLFAHHRQALIRRGLSDLTIERAGLRSLGSPAEAADLLRRPVGEVGSGIVIPYPDTSFLRVFLDQPHKDPDGEAVDFASPAGIPPRIYRPPGPDYGEAGRTGPLVLVASELEALGIAELGTPAMAAAGAIGFLTPVERGEETSWHLHADLAAVVIAGRQIKLSAGGSTIKAAVAEALVAKTLKLRGAVPSLIQTSAADPSVGLDEHVRRFGDGANVVLSELLLGAPPADPLERLQAISVANTAELDAGGLIRELRFMAALHLADPGVLDLAARQLLRLTGLRRASLDEAVASFRSRLTGQKTGARPAEYKFAGGRTYKVDEKTGVVPIADCIARIIEEVHEDEGGPPGRTLFLTEIATPSSPPTTITLLPHELEDPRSVVAAIEQKLGRNIRVRPNQERFFIDATHVGSDPRRTWLPAHTGWMDSDGKQVFALPRGSTSAKGPVEIGSAIDLLPLRQLGFPSGPIDRVRAFDALLRLLNAGAHTVTMPTLGHILAGPMKPHLEGRAPCVHILGTSGRFKTAFVKVLLKTYGAPSNGAVFSWTATPNALEHALYIGKDLTIVIDDLKLATVDVATPTRIIQSSADGSSRDRLKRDFSLAPTRSPRGLLLSTGEEVPEGQRSVMARLVVVPAHADWISTESLSAAQAEPYLAFGGRAWVEAIATSWCWLQENAAASLAHWRNEFTARLHGAHPRTPDALAVHMFTLERLFTFAGECFPVDYDRWCSSTFEALLHVGRETVALSTTAAAGRRFVEVIAAMLRTGEAHLAGPHVAATGMRGVQIGWLAENEVRLEADAAYGAAEQYLRRSGRSLGTNKESLLRALEAENLLAAREASHRTVRRVLPGGARVRVLLLRAVDLGLALDGDDDVSDGPSVAGEGPAGGPRIFS
jgi:hypothetical protein